MNLFFKSLFTLPAIFFIFNCKLYAIRPPVGESIELATPKEQLDSLLRVVPKTSHIFHKVNDIYFILNAQIKDQEKKKQEAESFWLKAIAVGEGSYGVEALHGWINNFYQGSFDDLQSHKILKVLLNKTKNGEKFLYYKKYGRRKTIGQIKKIIKKEEPKTVKSPKSYGLKKGIPSHDLLLTRTAKKMCNTHYLHSPRWNKWLSSLPKQVKIYWQALNLKCEGKAKESIKQFSHFISLAKDRKELRPYVIISLQNLTALQRFNARRGEAADNYMELVKVWKMSGLTPKTMGMSKSEFILTKANDYLWSSRYRSLVNDQKNAKKYAKDVIRQLNTRSMTQLFKKKSNKKKLIELKAEAYYILANRIAVEEEDFKKAYMWSQRGGEIKGLPIDWTERFFWSSGLYSYLNDNKDQALRQWSKLMVNLKSKWLEPKLFFWLARVNWEIGNEKECKKFITKLNLKYPLSFYNLVALDKMNLPRSIAGERVFFKKYSNLENSLLNRFSKTRTKVHKHKKFKDMILRSEIFIFANLTKWAKLETSRLYWNIHRNLGFKQNIQSYLYLSQLLHQAQNYAKNISLISEMADLEANFWTKWPEQILIYFPRAYAHVFKEKADQNSVDVSLLWAIARQESAFRQKARSFADARGLMQIILPTAKVYAKKAGLRASQLNNDLFKPEVNIELGSRLLNQLTRTYGGLKPPVYAAYNAGEFAVDAWIKRRFHPDPLLWIELIPFGETRKYVPSVWRNYFIYERLKQGQTKLSIDIQRHIGKSKI